MSPALEGGFLTTGPPEKSLFLFFTGTILSMKFNKRKLSLVRFLFWPLLLFVPFRNFMKNNFVV